jgi:flagellum-specific peptidoglycan hydrolase FlgJ
MNCKDFVKKFYPYAKQSEEKTGIRAVAILAQAALETGWGEHAPGNMFFGVKDHTGDDSKRQLITTTEFHKTKDVKYPEIISITPNGNNGFKYKVKDWFRKYETPEESFTAHSELIRDNKRYKAAMAVRHNTYAFLQAIADAGYATDPDYARVVISIAKKIEKEL